MSVSMEALAMAGTDYLEWGVEIEDWEHEDFEPPPSHLLADEEDEDDETRRESKKKMSVEALAMAGVDYAECGIDVEAWEHGGLEQIPEYLLAEQRLSNKNEQKRSEVLVVNEQWLKEKMLEWAKAVASISSRRSHVNRSLAMAGVDCMKCGSNLEEMKHRDMEKTPEYLLAKQIPCKDDVKGMVEQMEEWQVKAVASISITAIDT
ncbi:hypothetical protein Patl1_12413 [Pistacia atlantica]|uniref:Uncharacterized protein n=1 Tax=Pistacia atlantica TaxID=434234 RepID=A0ACC1A4C0_9ROSI|nr:hypothetical protein Patl1_12413 [Pistacia atlantica]